MNCVVADRPPRLRPSRQAQRTSTHVATSYACRIPGHSAAGREVRSLRRLDGGGVALPTRARALPAGESRAYGRSSAPASASRPVVDVVVVDSDPILRRSVADTLSEDGIGVLGMTGRGRDGMRLAAELAPAALIVDRRLPDMDGLELVQTLARDAPRVAVLLLAADESEEFALEALRAGAAGVLHRGVSPEALPRIVRGLAAGEAVMTRALSMQLVELLRAPPAAGRGLRPVRSVLSTREWEVLDLICAGVGTRAIAEELGLSAETVRSHVKRLLRKLGAHSRAEAAAIATRALAECARPAITAQRPHS